MSESYGGYEPVSTITITPKAFGTTTYRIYSIDNNTIYKDVTVTNTQVS